MTQIILASTSPYRKELLSKLKISFECHSPSVNEDEYKNNKLSPKELSKVLAKEKALSLKEKFPNAIIIGSDQVAAIGDSILSKPGSFENAFIQLKKLNNQTHSLYTSFCLVSKNQELLHSNTTTLKMRALSEEQIRNYLENDKPYDCAGSYKIESLGISLFEKIETEDFTSIIGLPLMQLTYNLNKLGIVIP